MVRIRHRCCHKAQESSSFVDFLNEMGVLMLNWYLRGLVFFQKMRRKKNIQIYKSQKKLQNYIKSVWRINMRMSTCYRQFKIRKSEYHMSNCAFLWFYVLNVVLKFRIWTISMQWYFNILRPNHYNMAW